MKILSNIFYVKFSKEFNKNLSKWFSGLLLDLVINVMSSFLIRCKVLDPLNQEQIPFYFLNDLFWNPVPSSMDDLNWTRFVLPKASTSWRPMKRRFLEFHSGKRDICLVKCQDFKKDLSSSPANTDFQKNNNIPLILTVRRAKQNQS